MAAEKSNGVKVKRRKLSEYTLDPENANKGSVRSGAMLEYSVDQFGPARSGVVDKNGVMRAGNHTAEQLFAAGIEDVIEVETTGKEWVVVKRADMEGDEAKRYAIADNRTGQLIEWDAGALQALIDEGQDLSRFFNDGEIAHLLNQGDELDYGAAWQGMPEFEQEDQRAFKTIIVHFDTEEDVNKFASALNHTVTMKTRYIWYPNKPYKDNTQYRVKDES